LSQPITILCKPKFRGIFHQYAFFIFLGACIMLLAKCSQRETFIAASIYSFGLLFLFGCSSVYHRFTWSPKTRIFIQKFDHSAIFILIASTVTPIAILALPTEKGRSLLTLIWIATSIGVLISVLWVSVPKWFMAGLCVCIGWLSFPYLSAFKASLSPNQVWLLVAGGITYSSGAFFYATKRPKLWPQYFGYHELFHLCTLIAASFHFIAIYFLIN
jgi:hemolysin III